MTNTNNTEKEARLFSDRKIYRIIEKDNVLGYVSFEKTSDGDHFVEVYDCPACENSTHLSRDNTAQGALDSYEKAINDNKSG